MRYRVLVKIEHPPTCPALRGNDVDYQFVEVNAADSKDAWIEAELGRKAIYPKSFVHVLASEPVS
ncbi:MAG: hypothetical protein ACWGQW_00270 [bacterium]